MNYSLIIIIAALTATLIFGYLLFACKTSNWPYNKKEEFGKQETFTIDAVSELACAKYVNTLPETYNDPSLTFNPKSQTCTIKYTPLASF